ncbi:hypothetical protein ATI61_112124 [Archangium gephyra]|uniref:DUF2087 domain-containing protein n=2 Tax=Archangium gephyra TaxID=48 RepID=A0ABX9JS81_9BACT|nr:DUF2087 domain-containing protein [Archangium gephyra]REG26029.1 hypothetical protein ATI61_112124 [Archangium gephyra]
MEPTPPTPEVSEKLARYLDEEGRLKGWPSKRSDQLQALHYMAARLPSGVEWSERELNELLKALHTFGDWALLRRDLYDARLLDRSLDGRRYWKVPKA